MRFAAGSPGVVMDKRFDVLAEVGPRFGGVVYLLVSLGEAAIGSKGGLTEGKDDGIFDGVVSGAVVHRAVGGVFQIPGFLCHFVGLDVGGEVRAGRVP